MSAFSFTASGQTPLNIDGESLFRSNGYGVANHSFDILVTQTVSPFGSNPNTLTTGSCPSSIFSGIIGTYGTATQNVNTLQVLPSSVNDFNDYINGVTTLDLVHITRHINGIASLNTLTPTADGPYRRISADANFDHSITSADHSMLGDLILGIRTDLTRTSWEWVNADDVANNSVDFNNNPYDYVINYVWPLSGFVFAARSRNSIIADMPDYFTYRSTKIGDIVGSGSGSSGTNSWICGTGTYITGENTENRTSNLDFSTKVLKGNAVKVRVDINAISDLMSVELPISINNESFEISKINCASNSARWNYMQDENLLMFIDYDYSSNVLGFTGGQYVEIDLIAKKDIDDIHEFVYWSKERNIEIIDDNLHEADAVANMEIILQDPQSDKIIWDSNNNSLTITSKNNGSSKLSIYNLSGQKILELDAPYDLGKHHRVDLNHLNSNTLYIATLRNNNSTTSHKFFKN